MKILWIVDKEFDIAPDLATWIEMSRCLQKRNDIKLVGRARFQKRDFKELNKNIIYLKSTSIPFLNRILFYFNQIKEYSCLLDSYDPDVVLFNTNNYWLIKKAIKLKDRYKSKLIFDVRTLVVSSIKSSGIKIIIENTLFKRSLYLAAKKIQGVSYITHEMKKYCCKKYNLQDHKSCIWESGVDCVKFIPLINEGLQSRHNIFKIIYHGSVADNRGLKEVISAMDLLRNEPICFSIIGDGVGLEELKMSVLRLDLTSKVEFLGRINYEEMPKYINQFDIGIIPLPFWDGWNTSSPIKLFEYLACGKPVIATSIPAHQNVLKDKDFVFWIKESNPQSIAMAIEEAYQTRNRFDDLGRKARDFVLNNYTWEKQSFKLEEFMKMILSNDNEAGLNDQTII